LSEETAFWLLLSFSWVWD